MTGDIERASDALQFIPSADRDTWWRMGMAIKSGFGETGFDLWNTWSIQDDSYDPKDAQSTWKSFTIGGKVGIGTLFHEAKVNGWQDDGKRQPVTPEVLAERQRKADERAAQIAADEVNNASDQAAAAKNAAALIKAGRKAQPNNPYLKLQQIPPRR